MNVSRFDGRRHLLRVTIRLSDNWLRAASRALKTTHWLTSIRLAVTSAEAWWWGADATGIARATTDDMGMDGARDAVLHLHVQLRDDINIINRSILQITLGGSLNHIANYNTLNGLILLGGSGGMEWDQIGSSKRPVGIAKGYEESHARSDRHA